MTHHNLLFQHFLFFQKRKSGALLPLLFLFVHNCQLPGCDNWESDMLEVLSSRTEWIWLYSELTNPYQTFSEGIPPFQHLKHMI